MSRILTLFGIGAVVIVLACEGPPPSVRAPSQAASPATRQPPAPAQPVGVEPQEPSRASTTAQLPLSESAETYVTALERIAAYFDAHSTDCAALASSLEAAGEARAHLANASTGPAHQHASSVPELQTRLATATHTIADGSMRCSKNPKFAAVQAKGSKPGPVDAR